MLHITACFGRILYCVHSTQYSLLVLYLSFVMCWLDVESYLLTFIVSWWTVSISISIFVLQKSRRCCCCRRWLICQCRYWRQCWWERSWWSMSVASTRMMNASPEALFVELSLYCAQSAQTGTCHWHADRGHQLVTGSEPNWRSWLNVSR